MKKPHRWYLFLGLLLLGAVVVAALLAGHITAVSPDYRDRSAHILDGLPPFAPSSRHPLGTDQYGRDIWSRVVYGARYSLLFGGAVALGRLLIALPVGVWSAFGFRPLRWLTERSYAFTSSFPLLLLYLLLLGNPMLRTIGLWPSALTTGVILIVLEWPRIAVWVQGRAEHLLREPYVEGAVAVGATRGRIFRRHLFPHLWPGIMQMVARELGRALLVLAELGIFAIMMGGGYTDQLDTGRTLITLTVSGVPEWGSMLADGKTYALTAPWIVLAPAVAFFLTMTGANLVAQGWGIMPMKWGSAQTDTSLRGWRGAVARYWRSMVAVAVVLCLLLAYQPWNGSAAATPCETATLFRDGQGKAAPLTLQRGYHVDVLHYYDPHNPSLTGVGERQQVSYLAIAADRGYEQMVQLLGVKPGARHPIVQLFPLHDIFVRALTPSLGADAADAVNLTAVAHGCISVSPKFLANKDNSLAQRALAMELGKSMIGPDAPLSPITTGLLVRGTEDRPGFRVDYKNLVGRPLLSLRELFSQTPASLDPRLQPSFMVQSNLVVEFLKQWLTDDQLQQFSREQAGLAEVARTVGLSEEELSARYTDAAFKLVAGESVMTSPAAHNRIPKALEDAVNGGKPANRVVLDADVSPPRATVYVLDRSAGQSVVKMEFWLLHGEQWGLSIP